MNEMQLFQAIVFAIKVFRGDRVEDCAAYSEKARDWLEGVIADDAQYGDWDEQG